MSARRLPASEIVRRLGGSLGEEQARGLVEGTARELGLDGSEFEVAEALAILERLTARPGLIGIVARFAKVRVMLQ